MKHKLKYSHNSATKPTQSLFKSYEAQAYLDTCTKSINKIIKQRKETIPRLSAEESTTIKAILWNLRNNEFIVIKPADKNLGPTIMDKQWYISAGELIL